MPSAPVFLSFMWRDNRLLITPVHIRLLSLFSGIVISISFGTFLRNIMVQSFSGNVSRRAPNSPHEDDFPSGYDVDRAQHRPVLDWKFPACKALNMECRLLWF